MNSQDKAKLFHEKQKEYLRRREEVNQLYLELRRDENNLYDTMKSEGIPSITIEDRENITYKPCEEVNFSLVNPKWDGESVWNNQEFHTWCHNNNLSGIIKQVESVHHATGKKALTEWKESGKLLPPFLRINYYNNVKFNMSAMKRNLE